MAEMGQRTLHMTDRPEYRRRTPLNNPAPDILTIESAGSGGANPTFGARCYSEPAYGLGTAERAATRASMILSRWLASMMTSIASAGFSSFTSRWDCGFL